MNKGFVKSRDSYYTGYIRTMIREVGNFLSLCTILTLIIDTILRVFLNGNHLHCRGISNLYCNCTFQADHRLHTVW